MPNDQINQLQIIIAEMQNRLASLERKVLDPLTVTAQEQKNICALVTKCNIGGSTSYGGNITAADASTSVLPAGWTVSRGSLGNYTVTHNLGTTGYAVTIVIEPAVAYVVRLNGIGSNSFSVQTLDNTFSFVDSLFSFVVVPIV